MTLSDALDSAAAREERVILFAQLADGASLRVREPEAVWLSTYAWFLETVAETIEGEGRLVKYCADGALYVFDKDRAADAINSAILMQEAVSAGSATRTVAGNAAIGIAAGEAVAFKDLAGRSDYAGLVVDRAIALGSAAMGKAILADAATVASAARGRIRSRAGEMRQPPRPPEDYVSRPQRLSVAGLPAPIELLEIYWDQPAPLPRLRLPVTPLAASAVEEGAPSSLEERQTGTVRRWDRKKGQGFIISKEGEFFYVDRRYTAGPPELNPGAKVFFLPRAPLIEGKNRVAACVLALGQTMQGKVVRVGKKGFGFVEVGDTCGNTQRLFMFLGENRDGIGGGDSVGFVVGENDRGPVAQNASRANPAPRHRHDPAPLGEREQRER